MKADKYASACIAIMVLTATLFACGSASDEPADNGRGPDMQTNDLVEEIRRKLPTMDEDALMSAIDELLHEDSDAAADLLLELATHEDLDIAAGALDSLQTMGSVPRVSEIVRLVRETDDPVIRGQLYLIAGRSEAPDAAEVLSPLSDSEGDLYAAADLEAALAKVGVDAASQALALRIASADVDEVVELSERLIYIGDQRNANLLLPWMEREEEVARVGGDRAGQTVRTCDVAVWTASRLEIDFEPAPTHLTRYSSEVRASATRAIQRLE
jgi:HEAT repeat protein